LKRFAFWPGPDKNLEIKVSEMERKVTCLQCETKPPEIKWERVPLSFVEFYFNALRISK